MPPARFLGAAISTSEPMPTKKMPAASTMWGGLTICTSRPKESCHQLSNGAEMSMVAPPQAARKAPNGPRKPQTLTVAWRAEASLPNVAPRIRAPQHTAASTAPNWMARCAGVQKLSRPMVMCQEMSQYSPKIIDEIDAAPAQRGHGIAAVADRARAEGGKGNAALWAMEIPPRIPSTIPRPAWLVTTPVLLGRAFVGAGCLTCGGLAISRPAVDTPCVQGANNLPHQGL